MNTAQDAEQTHQAAEERKYATFFQVLNFLLGVIEGTLLLRFTLLLLGANPGAAFVQFIYQLSGALMLPFRFIIPEYTFGDSVVEWSVFIAMMVYYLVMYLIKRATVIFYTADADTEAV